MRISSSTYTIDLTDGSGFYYGMYLADGTNAAYDSATPFELNVFRNSTNISQENSTEYNWDTKGSIYLSNWQSVSNLVERRGMNYLAQKNQIYYNELMLFLFLELFQIPCNIFLQKQNMMDWV